MAIVGRINFIERNSKNRVLSQLFVFWIATLLSVSSIAAPRILGGEEVESDVADSRYPWMVSLRDSNSGEQVCGATLIDEKWIISASHCAYGQSAHSLSAVLGDYDLSLLEDTEQRIDIIRRVESGRDLVLMELAVTVDTSLYPPLQIADQSIMETVSVGDRLEVIGWGARSGGVDRDYPTTLHNIFVPMISNNACEALFSNGLESKPPENADENEVSTFLGDYLSGQSSELNDQFLSIMGEQIDNNHICTLTDEDSEEVGGGPCLGDAGGPLVYETSTGQVQVGVISFSSKECDQQAATVYTKVSEFYEWAQETINQRDLSLSSLTLGDLVASVVDSVDQESGEVTFELESVALHAMDLTNSSSAAVIIEDVKVELLNSVDLDDPNTDEVEGQKIELFEERFHDFVRLDASEAEVLQCTGAQLEAGESCQIRLESRFVNEGSKKVALTFEMSEQTDDVSFELTGNVLGQTDYSSSFAENAYLFQQRSNEWQTESSIREAAKAAAEAAGVQLDDYVVEDLAGQEVLLSTMENYDETRLLAKLKGSGVFYFDWFVEDASLQNLSLYMNGELVKSLDVDGLFVRESLLIEIEDLSTLEFRLAQGEEWPEIPIDQNIARQYAAKIKSMRFEPDVVETEEAEEVSEEDDSGSGSISYFGLLMCLVLSVFRNRFLLNKKKLNRAAAGGLV